MNDDNVVAEIQVHNNPSVKIDCFLVSLGFFISFFINLVISCDHSNAVCIEIFRIDNNKNFYNK